MESSDLDGENDSHSWTDYDSEEGELAVEEEEEEQEDDEGSWGMEWDEEEELDDWLLWGSGSSSSEFSSEDEDSSYLKEIQEEISTLEEEDPELLTAVCRLITAVMQNNLEEVRELIRTPERFYKITISGDFHNNLLQIAMQADSRDVFDYLLASGLVPLEAVNDKNQTALMISLTPNFLNMFNKCSEYYACELLNKVTDVWGTCSDGNTLLHYAVKTGSTAIVKMLIDGGLNPNEPNVVGRTPFHMCFVSKCSPQAISDVISVLLSGGADPSILDPEGFTVFEHAMRCEDLLQIQEMLFYRLLENYTIKMDASILLDAMNSPLFYYIITWPGLEISNGEETMGEYITKLFSLDPVHLNIFIKKGCSVVRKILQNSDKDFENIFSKPIIVENLNAILDSELKDDLIELIASCKVSIPNLIRMRTPESILTKMICYLLSYGLTLYESNLQDIYIRYGYCDLLKICLHMDIVKDEPLREIMPALIYDVHLNLQTCLKDSFKYSIRKLDCLLQHFAGEKVKDFCYRVGSLEIMARAKKLPQIPSLQELARNTFRQSFIDTFHIETSRQFHTMVGKLPVCNIFKKMLTYEQRLY